MNSMVTPSYLPPATGSGREISPVPINQVEDIQSPAMSTAQASDSRGDDAGISSPPTNLPEQTIPSPAHQAARQPSSLTPTEPIPQSLATATSAPPEESRPISSSLGKRKMSDDEDDIEKKSGYTDGGQRKREKKRRRRLRALQGANTSAATASAVLPDIELYQCGNRTYICVVAPECGHWMHPSVKRWQSPRCPRCETQKRLEEMQEANSSLNLLGPIVYFAGSNGSKQGDGQEPTEEGRRRAKNREKHIQLLHGCPPEGKDPGTQGWLTSKVNFINQELHLEVMADSEYIWDQEKSLEGVDMPWTKNSARKALRFFREKSLERDAVYVACDPVSHSNYRTPRDMISSMPFMAKRKRNASGDEESPAQEARKRRKTGVRFNAAVTISRDHDIDINYQRLPEQLRPQPSTAQLCDEPSRRSVFFKRSLGSKPSPYYRSGRWASHTGYQKANTSWMGHSHKDMVQPSEVYLLGPGLEPPLYSEDQRMYQMLVQLDRPAAELPEDLGLCFESTWGFMIICFCVAIFFIIIS